MTWRLHCCSTLQLYTCSLCLPLYLRPCLCSDSVFSFPGSCWNYFHVLHVRPRVNPTGRRSTNVCSPDEEQQQETKKANAPVSPHNTAHKMEKIKLLDPTATWLGRGSLAPSKETNVRSLGRIDLHLSVLKACVCAPSKLTREIHAKLISCRRRVPVQHWLKKKRTLSMSSSKTFSPGPPTLRPPFFYSNFSGALFQLPVHLYPLLFIDRFATPLTADDPHV